MCYGEGGMWNQGCASSFDSVSLHPAGLSQHMDKASPSDSAWLVLPERVPPLFNYHRHALCTPKAGL